MAFAINMLGTWLLLLTERAPFLRLFFEAMSALANVGWSQGITPTLGDFGAMVLVVLMFPGRLGPLLIALSLPDRPEENYRYPEAAVRLG